VESGVVGVVRMRACRKIAQTPRCP
jgi:hypothetical protein